MTVRDLISDVLVTDVIRDLDPIGDRDVIVANLELEDGHDFLLEDGFFILLE